ncbi:MAG: type II toxin-antitoxin system VapC family toxin [Candidatus Jordarchaeaceae archaeon]
MKLFLDSSYLIYLRYAESDEVFNYVTGFLREAVKRGEQLLVNMIVIDETTWILTQKYGFPLSEVFELIDRLMSLMEVIPVNYTEYDVMKKVMMEYGLKPSDAIHVASMNKSGAQHIVSEDKEFDKVPWIKRIWLDTKTH